MNGKRKQHTAEFRFKVALEALKGLKTVSELASIYEVHPGSWKRVTDDGYRSLSYRELAHELG
jgi:transposase-like protein